MSEKLNIEFVNVDDETGDFFEAVTDEQIANDEHVYILCEGDEPESDFDVNELSEDKGNFANFLFLLTNFTKPSVFCIFQTIKLTPMMKHSKTLQRI